MSTFGDDSGYVIPPRWWRWVATRRTVAVVLWLIALGTGIHHAWHARNWFNDRPVLEAPQRRIDGNNGHAQIDFGGQWVMARMIATGHGRELYHRQRQREIARAGFQTKWEPPAVEQELFLPPSQRKWWNKPDDLVKHDADWMLYWFMGEDPPEWKTLGGAVALPLADLTGFPLTSVALQSASSSAVTPELVATLNKPAIGGPLYPPVQAVLYAPLALDDNPQRAYAIFQYLSLAVTYLTGLGISLLSRGRIWWSVASLAVLMYPGTRTGIDLGQNQSVSLAILVWGWVLASRGREGLGGAVWGLFAFKPVWGMAFFLVPLLTRRWRFCVAMVGTGALLGAATLPFVGLQSWFDWLAVGKEAAALYDVNRNWNHLSRDLQGIPRRMLLNFDIPESQRRMPVAGIIGWAMWGFVFVTTTAIYLLRGDRRKTTGLGAAFLFLGAYHSCYRFMFYDVLLSVLGVMLLFADPRRFVQPRPFALVPATPPPPSGPRWTAFVNSFPLTMLTLIYLVDGIIAGLKVEATVGFGYFERVVTSGNSTALATPKVVGNSSLDYPLDAVLILALWAWCGWRLWRDGDTANGPA